MTLSALIALACGLSSGGVAWASEPWQPNGALKKPLAATQWEFFESAGWGGLEVAPSADLHTVVVRFGAAPPKAAEILAELLVMRGTNSVDLAAFEPTADGGGLLLLRSRRPLHRAHAERVRKLKAWRLHLQFGPLPPLPGVGYAALLPEGQPAREAMEDVEEAWARPDLDCRQLQAHTVGSETWVPWVRLTMADCYRRIGKRNEAILELRRLATTQGITMPVVALASLRMEESPDTWNPHQKLPWPKRREILALPGPVIQELLLRAARHLLDSGRAGDASRFLITAAKKGVWAGALRQQADLLRLELMVHLADSGRPRECAKAYKAAAAPSFESPAGPGTARLGALALARSNHVAEALKLAQPLLATGRGFIDPELLLSLHGALVRAGKTGASLTEISSQLPRNLRWLERLTARGVVSAALGEELGLWLDAMRQQAGSRPVAEVLAPLSVHEGTSNLAERRMATLLALRDCPALTGGPPASSPRDWPAFAAACHLSGGDAAGALSALGDAQRDHGSFETPLSDAMRRYALGAVELYSDVAEPGPPTASSGGSRNRRSVR